VLTPNEIETQALSGLSAADDELAARAAAALRARGVGAVVLTLGARGALLADGERILQVPGYVVQVVDTTAAGDAFCGALGTQLARGRSLETAVRYANAAGALATTVLGAEPAMPRREAVEQLVTR
jgi:ribokinase